MTDTAVAQAPIRTTIPARLDRLRWSPFHTRMVAGLGAAWILDGLHAIGTIAGAIGPAFYGALIGDGSDRTSLFIGYLVGAGIMIIGGVVEWLIGINAEGKSLESVTKPLTAIDATPATA